MCIRDRFFHRSSKRQWAREEAIPQIASLIAERKPLAAYILLQKAQSYLPGDPQLKLIADQNTLPASIASSPSGATAEIQDYSTPDAPWSVSYTHLRCREQSGPTRLRTRRVCLPESARSDAARIEPQTRKEWRGRQRRGPVSYTHLDVYKRQGHR